MNGERVGLAEFVLARIAEDEQAAAKAVPGPWSHVGEPRETSVFSEPTGVSVAHAWRRDADHITRWDPARVLAECEAKRLILADYERYRAERRKAYGGYDAPDHSPIAKALALPYASHPEYRSEWAP